MSKATAELPQVRDTMSTQEKQLAKLGQLKSSLNSLEYSVTIYKESEEELKNKLVAAIKHSTYLSHLVHDKRADLVD